MIGSYGKMLIKKIRQMPSERVQLLFMDEVQVLATKAVLGDWPPARKEATTLSVSTQTSNQANVTIPETNIATTSGITGISVYNSSNAPQNENLCQSTGNQYMQGICNSTQSLPMPMLYNQTQNVQNQGRLQQDMCFDNMQATGSPGGNAQVYYTYNYYDRQKALN